MGPTVGNGFGRSGKRRASVMFERAGGEPSTSFVVCRGIAPLVSDCFIVEEAGTRLRRPVRMVFSTEREQRMVRILRAPHSFPAEPVFGPRREQAH